MNLHPIVIHFPIALFSLYAVCELAGLMVRIRTYSWLEHIKTFLVVTGTALSFVAIQTGESVAESMRVMNITETMRSAIAMHERFANATSVIFTVISLVYLFRIVEQRAWFGRMPKFLQSIVTTYLRLLDHRVFLVLAASMGLLAITVTGALGGSLVYGADVDPIVKLIYRILF